MKKRLKSSLALLATLALAVSLFLIPSGAATDLQALIDAAPEGGTVTLTEDVAISTSLEINKALTIDGANHALTYTGSAGAINTQTNDPLTLKNLTLNATASGGRGVEMFGSAPIITVENCTLNVHTRGISARSNTPTTGASVTVNNSLIQNSQLPVGKTYDTWAALGDYRGISAWNMKQAVITVTNSTIQGFAYCINVAGNQENGIMDTMGTRFQITNCHLKGWTTFNIWGAKSTYDIVKTELLGINVATGGTNSFATIVVNDDIYGTQATDPDAGLTAWANEINITGGSIKNYVSQATLDAGLTEQLIRIDKDGVTKIVFSKYGRANVAVQDCAGCCDSALYSPVWDAETMQGYYNNKKLVGKDYCTAVKSDGTTALPLLPAV